MSRFLSNVALATALVGDMFGPTAALAGSIDPFTNIQPSLAVTEVTATTGLFPTTGEPGPASGNTLGFVYDFAGNFAPSGSSQAQGQLLNISQNNPLFNVIGTTYGGNGTTTFALPNLAGQATIGAGTGAGLPTQQVGIGTGSATVALSPAQIPGYPGGNQPFNNLQPSLPLTPLIAISGAFPTSGESTGSAAFLGQIANFAGPYVPSGWAPANGQLLSIALNKPLFNVIGTTYGGNGTTTFALPDLQGRVAVGANIGYPGTVFGQQSTFLTAAQLPPGGAPVNNIQPSLAIIYLIATSGLFPSQGENSGGFNSSIPILGEITEFAGNYVPSGWTLANGQLLSIALNNPLFSVIGTTYGGDGITTFALPDLEGETLIGTGNGYYLGELVGTNQVTLTGSVSPNITPLPSTWLMLISGFVGLGFLAYRGTKKRIALAAA